MNRPNKLNYLNYTTSIGVPLAHVAKAGWSPFLIHDAGFHPSLENWNHPGVDSPFWRLYHNPSPGCHIRHQGQNLPLEPNSCLLIPANTVFDCCGPVSAQHFWIHFTVSRLSGEVPTRPLLMPLDETLQILIRVVLETLSKHSDKSNPQRLYHEAAALLHSAFARIELPKAEVIPEPLLEVLTLIQKAPHSYLPNSFLAERAGMSLERFIRAFRQHVGQTPAAYVTATRLRLAGEMLVLTDKSIDQIAVEHGFPNRHYFSRLFIRSFGCGPAEFRSRQHRKRGK